MWILLWLALGSNFKIWMDYHIGTFATQDECVKVLSKAL